MGKRVLWWIMLIALIFNNTFSSFSYAFESGVEDFSVNEESVSSEKSSNEETVLDEWMDSGDEDTVDNEEWSDEVVDTDQWDEKDIGNENLDEADEDVANAEWEFRSWQHQCLLL